MVIRARIALWYDWPSHGRHGERSVDSQVRGRNPNAQSRAEARAAERDQARARARRSAKERQRLVESRISMLQKRVSEIALLNVERIPKDRAGFGSTLHVVEITGDKHVFQLVMPEDADATRGLISTTSPIG